MPTVLHSDRGFAPTVPRRLLSRLRSGRRLRADCPCNGGYLPTVLYDGGLIADYCFTAAILPTVTRDGGNILRNVASHGSSLHHRHARWITFCSSVKM